MKKLYVVDDDPIATFGITKLLSVLVPESKTESFPNGKEALDSLMPRVESDPDNLPDCIFLDINMPVMDGWQFLEGFGTLKKTHQFKQPVVYILSSSISSEDQNRAQTFQEVTGYIVKPVSMDELKVALAV